MHTQKLILDAVRAGYDTIKITSCGSGTLIKSSNSNKMNGYLGGANILSAGGSSNAEIREESLMDTLDTISDGDVRGLLAVGWLINASCHSITLFKNPAAGGRRHQNYTEVAIEQSKLRRVS